jgi:hypothetical protein
MDPWNKLSQKLTTKQKDETWTLRRIHLHQSLTKLFDESKCEGSNSLFGATKGQEQMNLTILSRV